MDLIRQLTDHVTAFVEDQASLDDLSEWLSSNAPELAAVDDADARRLNGRAWTLGSEYGYGHRSEASVRLELAKMLGSLTTRIRESVPSRS